MNTNISKNFNISLGFDSSQGKTLYDIIYEDAAKIYKTRKNVTEKTLREELLIPFSLSVQIIEKLHQENK